MMNDHINMLVDPDSMGAGQKERVAEFKKAVSWHISEPAVIMGAMRYYKYLERNMACDSNPRRWHMLLWFGCWKTIVGVYDGLS